MQVFLAWSIILVVVYYAYQIFHQDNHLHDTIRMDDSSQTSTTMLFGDDEEVSSGGTGQNQTSMADKLRGALANLKTSISNYYFPTTYDLNILVDSNNMALLETTIIKGEMGIGLALTKNKKNLTEITGFKEFPTWASHPARMSSPAILPGDCIVGVDGIPVKTFAAAVLAITTAPNGELLLHLRRYAEVKKTRRAQAGVDL